MIVKGALTSITLATLVVVEAATVPLQRFSARQSNNGLQDAVTWDNHTIIVNGEREFLFSGEFHVCILTWYLMQPPWYMLTECSII